MIVSHPCMDFEFRQGGECTERTLANGDLLVFRDIVVDRGDIETVEAVLVHPDGSRGAEAGTWTVPPLSGTVSQDETSASRLMEARRMRDFITALPPSPHRRRDPKRA